jgi:LPS export ABC transporter permease LptG/LPS export ABC transporter permease LptF
MLAKPLHRRPGSTLYRHLILEMIFPSLFTLGGLTVVILTKDLLGYSDLVINRGLGAEAVAWIAFYQTVPMATQMLPFAVMVGCLVALGRLGADLELLMLEACGISPPRLLGPVMVFASAVAVIGLVLSLWGAPLANRSLDASLDEIAKAKPAASITVGRIHHFGSWKLEAREVSSSGDRMRGVLLWMPDVDETVFAEAGALDATPLGETQITLEGGAVMLSPREEPSLLRFERMQTILPEGDEPIAREEHERLGGMTLTGLRQFFESEQTPRWLAARARIQLHRRFALPAATLVLGLLVVPLFLSRAHFSRAGGGVLGIIATLSYYGLVQLGDALTENGKMSVLLGVWLPNLVMGAVALVLAIRMTRLSSFGRTSSRPETRTGSQKRVSRKAAAELKPRRWSLQRYVAMRFLQMMVLCFLVVLVGYLLVDILERMGWLTRYGATWGEVLRYYGARIPLLASRVTPMSLLVATALTVSLLTSQGELMGMRVCGIPAPRALLPILIICALIVPAYFALNDKVLPQTNTLAAYLKRVVKRKPTRIGGLASAWFRVGNQFYEAEILDPKAGIARGITIYRLSSAGLPESRVDAVEARHIGGGVWRLLDAVRSEVQGDALKTVDAGPFAELGEAVPADVNTRQLSIARLRREIAEVEENGRDATPYRVDYYVKFASPFACLVLPALALLFALGGPPHPSSSLTLVFSVIVAVGYVLLSGVATSLGYGGVVPPAVAGWFPIAIFALLVGYLGMRLRGLGQSFSRR